MSVSPVAEEAGDEVCEGEGTGDSDAEWEGEMGQRLRAPKEGEFIRKVKDPRLPTAEDVETHNLSGHIPLSGLVPGVYPGQREGVIPLASPGEEGVECQRKDRGIHS